MRTSRFTLSFIIVLAVVLTAGVAAAGDFDWTRDLNIRAEADRDGFRAQLSTRFKIGNADVEVVLGNVDSPADAYMVLRLGEMSAKPVDYVLNQYRTGKGKGWGVLAKSLGIKPGSREFQALKAGHDINGATIARKNNGKNKGR
ncbi:MAG: hypothetical protein JSV70_01130 [bacterium]|nr:MAG: hypothetical protein JSV70_01130 [bacterium]